MLIAKPREEKKTMIMIKGNIDSVAVNLRNKFGDLP